MKKELLALCLIAALPGCGCWRKNKDKAPKKAMTEKEVMAPNKSVATEKAAMPKKAKTHMDMQRY